MGLLGLSTANATGVGLFAALQVFAQTCAASSAKGTVQHAALLGFYSDPWSATRLAKPLNTACSKIVLRVISTRCRLVWQTRFFC